MKCEAPATHTHTHTHNRKLRKIRICKTESYFFSHNKKLCGRREYKCLPRGVKGRLLSVITVWWLPGQSAHTHAGLITSNSTITTTPETGWCWISIKETNSARLQLGCSLFRNVFGRVSLSELLIRLKVWPGV